MPRRILRSVGPLACAALAAIVIASGSASLADDDDHAKVPANAASLDAALAAVRRSHPGRVLKVELESEDDGPARWVYEVKVLTGAGHVLEIELDAVSLEVLGVEGGRSRHSDDD